jgi:ribosomal protein S18 acetylase RimI-like enzyme
MNILYRTAEKRDQEKIEHLNTAASDVVMLLYSQQKENLLNPEMYRQTGGEFWVAEDSDSQEIIGMVAVKFLDHGTAKVKALRIHPEYRRHRLATRLMDVLENYCRSKAIKTIVLGVNSRRVPAIRLYESLGYKKISEEQKEEGIIGWVFRKQLI